MMGRTVPRLTQFGRHMQDCFRLHPEVYGEELADDDQAAPADGEAPEGVLAKDASTESAGASTADTTAKEAAPEAPPETTKAVKRATDATEANAKVGEAKPEVASSTPTTKPAAPKPTKPE